MTTLARYAALIAAMVISYETQRQLALSHGVTGWPSYAVPLAIDAYLIWCVRSGRDVPLAVALSVAANVAGVLTADPLADVDTWVSAALHAAFPVTIWRMERPSSQVSQPAKPKGDWPSDDLWADFVDSASDSEAAPVASPPSVPDIRAAMAVLTSRHGHVNGQLLADHFGVSGRTGRRYLSLANA
ncbi:transfer protein spdA [Streptomyces europaeiscabiei]|uniref:Transfer protein spdA n=1 Tax=Streptomyces europaeiscabiei TaxID=146819 RepID=A0ABU4NRH4_9ACTN|nr:transfer protein spdA [Streptomyces europaeiscabiei]MDX3555325.1 transfer protein spdA [Streptomyces europaeiscabiei]MDX3705339.1 transfer protein spdA [Streptomyces europaeiscabiei]